MPHLHPTPTTLSQAVRLVLFGMSLASAPALLLMPAQAMAQSQTAYHVAAGPLGNAITQFGVQAGVTISFDTEQTRNLNSAGLEGSYSIEEGLVRLLGNSGFQAQRQGNGGYVLVPSDNGSAMELGPLNIDANRLDATSEGTQSYTARAVTIGKGVHTLKETPQSVTVMTRKMLDDQNLNTLEQVLDKTPAFIGGSLLCMLASGSGIALWQSSYLGGVLKSENYVLAAFLVLVLLVCTGQFVMLRGYRLGIWLVLPSLMGPALVAAGC